MNIEQLKARLVELNELAKAVQAKADAESRPLTVDEEQEIDRLVAEFEQVELDIKRREKIAAQESSLSQSAGRVVPPTQPVNVAERLAAIDLPTNAAPQGGGMRHTQLPTLQERARWGFRDFGDFMASVRNACVNPSNMDQRLIQNALSTYGSEGVAADGGFGVPPEWRAQIMTAVSGEGSLLSRTDQQTASGNSISFPVDETTAWQSTGGIQAYWDSEAQVITQSKPALKDLTVKLSRLTAMVPVTDELLEDAPSMGSYVARKAADKLTFKVNDAIINGTGSGQPLGILNAPCLVTVSKEASQAAGTFFGVNAVKMMARLPSNSFGNSVWLINQDVLPSILQLGFVVKNPDNSAAGAGALYLPPNGLANSSPYGSLLGRPIVVTEACKTIGTVGDVILADLTQFLTVTKTGGVRSDTSMHVYFENSVTAFRFVLRLNGQPWLSAAIARASGSNTLSHFVVLQAR